MASRRKQAKKQQRKQQRKQEKAGLNDNENNNNETLEIMAAGDQASDDNNDTNNAAASDIPSGDGDNDSDSDFEEVKDEEEAKSDSDNEERDEQGDYTFIVANDLRKGGFVLLRKEKHPCKVMEMHKSKTGKHGGAKIRVVGINILSGKKYDDIFLSKEQVEIPIVKKIKYDLIKIENNEALLRDLTPAKKTAAAPRAPEFQEIRIKLDTENNEIHSNLAEKARGSRPVQVVVVNAMNTDAIAEVRTV